MKLKFKNFFSFTQNEISQNFNNAKTIAQINGLKLLQAQRTTEYGKLLIITSRKMGKAHQRNKIRRQLKDIFFKKKLFTKKNIYILLVYSQALEVTFDELKNFLVKNIKND